jgi:hypothetical protein
MADLQKLVQQLVENSGCSSSISGNGGNLEAFLTAARQISTLCKGATWHMPRGGEGIRLQQTAAMVAQQLQQLITHIVEEGASSGFLYRSVALPRYTSAAAALTHLAVAWPGREGVLALLELSRHKRTAQVLNKATGCLPSLIKVRCWPGL